MCSIFCPFTRRRTGNPHFYGKSLNLQFLHNGYNIVVVIVENIDALSRSKFVEADWLVLQIANVNSLMHIPRSGEGGFTRIYAKFSSASCETILLFRNQRIHSKVNELFTQEVTSIYCFANF